ncbi:hypothetical protein [Nocardioides sp. GY 10127]|uniref:hypothetical protein n=1 Tax=Nocardioides sp. GY 10127 TaxID=2569762 RepID=UPI0010A86AF9|nr:hypothetical protein [Nocardioides sp. GY 10127]TIC84382.1 hypothetical protein E8D37_06335 [Nocardioides sp. GY 10127]
MTRIVIDDVDDLSDLLMALASVQSAFAEGRARFGAHEETFSKSATAGAPRAAERYEDEDAELLPPLVEYVPCPRRGTHLRLTECWMCWCDVQQGLCDALDALSPVAWPAASLSGPFGEAGRTEPPTGGR